MAAKEVGKFDRTSAGGVCEQAKVIPRVAKTPGTDYLEGQGYAFRWRI